MDQLSQEKYDELMEVLELVRQLPNDNFSVLAIFIDKQTGQTYYAENLDENLDRLFVAIAKLVESEQCDDMINNILGIDKQVVRH